MKRFAFLLLLTGWLVPMAAAQEAEHVSLGVYADYLHPSDTSNNMAGIGARLGFMAYKNLKFEASMNYDFSSAFNEKVGGGNTGVGVSVVRSNVHVLHGEFGPRVNLGPERWHFHPFVFAKGGFMHFAFSHAPATFGTFASNVSGLRDNNVSASFFPGGGIEGHIGPVGLRADVGDIINFAGGAHNNLNVTFGPFIRF